MILELLKCSNLGGEVKLEENKKNSRIAKGSILSDVHGSQAGDWHRHLSNKSLDHIPHAFVYIQ